MTAPTFDCAIVGAGPAGSATAIHLASAGLNVALLDRAAFPRPKPCGDCISPGANRLLERLGVLDRVQSHAAALHGWRIHSPSGACFEARFDRIANDAIFAQAYAIDRVYLDALLLDEARNAGATWISPAHVHAITPEHRFHRVRYHDADHVEHEIRCSLLIGADGLRSIVSRRCGLVGRAPRLRKLSLTAHARVVRNIDDCGELHVIDGACLGVAPVENRDRPHQPLCNITLVVDSKRFARDVAADATSFFLAMLRRFPAIAPRITDEAPGLLLGSGPFDRPVRSVVAPGVALVGDAAGYFDPFTGQGLYQSFAAAEHLAEHANTAFRAGLQRNALHGFARDHAAIVNGSRRLQQIIDRVCTRPAVMNRAVRAFADAPHAALRLSAVTGDLLPVRSLLSPNVALTFLSRFIAAETHSAYDR